jgi:5-methylcytosine-specific restriction enzyme A
MKKPAKRKIASGTTARAVAEWIGKTPDTPVPARVQLRILERQGGKCAITGRKFRVGDKKRLDHIIPAADGGANRESNRQWILDEDAHKPKTKAEAAVRKKVRAKAKAHAGIKTPPARKLESRNDFPAGAKEAKRDKNRLPVPNLPSALARRGFKPA